MMDSNLISYEDIYSEIKETLLLSRNQFCDGTSLLADWAYHCRA